MKITLPYINLLHFEHKLNCSWFLTFCSYSAENIYHYFCISSDKVIIRPRTVCQTAHPLQQLMTHAHSPIHEMRKSVLVIKWKTDPPLSYPCLHYKCGTQQTAMEGLRLATAGKRLREQAHMEMVSSSLVG